MHSDRSDLFYSKLTVEDLRKVYTELLAKVTATQSVVLKPLPKGRAGMVRCIEDLENMQTS